MFGPVAARLRMAIGFTLLGLCAFAGFGTRVADARSINANAAVTATLVGHVFIKGSAQPLGYSTVSIEAFGFERFSDAAGRFVLDSVPVGKPFRLRVRHIGYYPADVALTLDTGRAEPVRVELAPVAVTLSAIDVRADSRCTTPGRPQFGNDSTFAAIFEQVLQNAEQYRLLSNSYPFSMNYRGVRSSRTMSGMHFYETDHVFTYMSQESWAYEPGALWYTPGQWLRRNPTIGIPTKTPYGQRVLHQIRIPTLDQFAAPLFVANHCFTFKGLETVDSISLIRIDFQAAERIKKTDLNGSLYLDPVSYQLRRSGIRLSRPLKEVENLTSLEVITLFSEVLPGISTASSIATEIHYKKTKDSEAREAVFDTYKLLDVKFLKGKPGGRP